MDLHCSNSGADQDSLVSTPPNNYGQDLSFMMEGPVQTAVYMIVYLTSCLVSGYPGSSTVSSQPPDKIPSPVDGKFLQTPDKIYGRNNNRGWGGVGEHLKTSATKPLGTTDKQYMLPQICSGTQRYI